MKETGDELRLSLHYPYWETAVHTNGTDAIVVSVSKATTDNRSIGTSA
jgi:hypothetical protein